MAGNHLKKKSFILALSFAALTLHSQNTWSTKLSMPAGNERLGASSFSIGTKGYIATGYANPGNTFFSDLWEWDQVTNTWSQKATFIGTPRAWACAFTIGTKAYLGTGSDGTNDCQDFYEWDQPTNMWHQLSDFPYQCSEAVGFSIGQRGYIGTGSTNPNIGCQFWEYDAGIDTWVQRANFPGTARTSAVGFSIGTKGYIGTGSDALSGQEDFYEYDQATDQWTQKANFGGGARVAAVGFSIGTKGYIGTGWDVHYNTYRDFWEYDPVADTWTVRTMLNGNTRVVATGFSIGNKGYIATGYSGGSLRDLHEYTPGPVGVNDPMVNTDINVFYDRQDEKIIFNFGEEQQRCTAMLMDMNGELVRSIEFSGNTAAVERNDLASGVYVFEILSGDQLISSGKILLL